MKRYKSKQYLKDCRICGSFNESPLAMARAVTKKVLESEKLHSHKNGFEYYIFLKGKAELMVEDKKIKVSEGDIILVEPGEKHKLNKVIEEVDYITIKTNPDLSDKEVFLD